MFWREPGLSPDRDTRGEALAACSSGPHQLSNPGYSCRTASLVDDATVGLLLADPHGHLRFMAAPDESTRFLEIFQADKQDGPCVDAFHQRRPVVNTDLQLAADRWPQFAPHAAAAGFRSVHAFPLRLREEVIGALGVCGSTVGDLDATDVQIVQALADIAAISLLQQRSIAREELLTEQLQGALNTRIVIGQAKGAIAQLHNVGVDAAYQLIRDHSQRTGRNLSEVAYQVVTNLDSLPDLAGPRPE